MKRSWVHVPLKPEFLRLPCDFHKSAMIFVFNDSGCSNTFYEDC